MSEMDDVTISELIELCAIDSELFASEFFPNTVRLPSAPFHATVWKYLESSAPLVNIQMYRGSGKTTLLRLFVAKRLAYTVSKTALYVGRSEEKAVQSLKWIKQQIEHNKRFTDVYRLSRGSVWQEAMCSIRNERDNTEINLVAYGVSGSIRGVNLADYRPDLIIVDDMLDEENTATADQRAKTQSLLYGALVNSLASRADSPDAKLVMLQTPFNKEDASTEALDDPAWVSVRVGCWTEATQDLPDTEKISSWPHNYPSEELRAKKQSYLHRNAASIFAREWECRITSPETASFRSDWLNFYELSPPREDMVVLGAIDPVPPPSELQLAKGLKNKDYECLALIGILNQNYYLLDYSVSRGHEPNWTISEFFRLSLKWKPLCWTIETVAYQKTLQWLLRQAMIERRLHYPVLEMNDARSKYNRIVDCLAGPASNGVLHISRAHTEFISQFVEYPDCTHDDVLDAVSMCFLRAPQFVRHAVSGAAAQSAQSNLQRLPGQDPVHIPGHSTTMSGQNPVFAPARRPGPGYGYGAP